MQVKVKKNTKHECVHCNNCHIHEDISNVNNNDVFNNFKNTFEHMRRDKNNCITEEIIQDSINFDKALVFKGLVETALSLPDPGTYNENEIDDEIYDQYVELGEHITNYLNSLMNTYDSTEDINNSEDTCEDKDMDARYLDEPYTEEEVDKLELLNRISGFIDDMRGEIRARKETKFF